MKRLQDMIRRICERPPPGMVLHARPDGVDATLSATGRRQSVGFAIDGEHVVLRSVVLDQAVVTADADRWHKLTLEAWGRNMLTDIVLFSFDDAHNLVGRVIHPKATLDLAELRFYVATLLEECDRFEYVLTGADHV